MKLKFTYFVVAILLTFLSCSGQKNNINLSGVDRIPTTAFLVEKDGKGHWFDVERINNHRNIALISIFDARTGDLIVKNRFIILCPVEKMEYISDLEKQIDFYDGQDIQLKSDCYLVEKK